jgi:ABC-2 type transport system permease protein
MSPADSPPLPAPTVLRTLKKYLNIFRASLIERMAYRGDFLLGTVLRFLPMLTTILLWQAVFLGADNPEIGRGGNTYNFREMIAYLLLVHVSRMFSSMPGLATGIARDIREGTLKKYLLQPLDMIGYLVSYRTAHKAAYIATSALPYALLFYLCRGFFDGFPDPLTFAGYVASLLLGFLIGFFFEAAVGMIGFWFLEVTSFLYVINTLNFFVSGHMFPLDLLPPGLARALKMLPFHYLAYFPATVFLGKVRGAELAQGLLVELLWVVGLIVLARVLYRRGLRHYSAFGG